MEKNFFLSFLIICIVVIFLTGCLFSRYRVFHKMPDEQLGSIWISEDSTMRLIISDKDLGSNYLEAKVGDETLIFECHFGMSSSFILCSMDASEDGIISSEEIHETWSGDFVFWDRFTATVEKTMHFEEGQKIKFYRIDE